MIKNIIHTTISGIFGSFYVISLETGINCSLVITLQMVFHVMQLCPLSVVV